MLSALAVLLLVVSQLFPYPVFADEIVVSGNGDGSQNGISINETKSNTTVQENEAVVENKIDSVADTGGNSVDNNSGEVEITTGDIAQAVTVINSGNSNQAETGCCNGDPGSMKITDNGTDSNNEIDLNHSTSNTVNVNNNLQLSNNIQVTSNTGDNEASGNSGDVAIETGGVNILAQILNKNLNSNKVTVSSSDPLSNLKISGNGNGSKNEVNDNAKEYNQYSITNALVLDNTFISYANTGGNKAKGNLGKVFISTGSIMLDIILANYANSNELIDQCCKNNPPSPTPPPTSTPTPTPTPGGSTSPSPTPQGSCCSPTTDIPGPGGGGGSGGSSSGGGEVLGSALPATGGMSLWLLTGIALLMLAAGVILRTDSNEAQIKLKKAFGKFTNSIRLYTFGFYLYTNLKVIPAFKT